MAGSRSAQPGDVVMGWTHTGRRRPAFATAPGDGQESVWDYPRPPALVPDGREIVVRHGGAEIARTRRAVRVLETASPPTFYLPLQDVAPGVLVPAKGSSWCEWKGHAHYWSLRTADGIVESAAWSYPQPTASFQALRDYISFYPSRVECYVDGERVRPQSSRYYGGWITDDIVGPFKGEPGTGGW